MRKKVIILIIICIIIAIISIIFISNKNQKQENQNNENVYYIELQDGAKQNVSPKISEKKTFENLDIVNASIVYSDNICKMKLNVENNSDIKSDDMIIKINIFDSNNDIIITLTGFVAEISPGKSIEVNLDSSFDYSNAYDYEILRK